MSEPALRRMTVDEFLNWNHGTDTRFELIDGVPVAMAPASGAHQIIAVNLAVLLKQALRHRPPCTARAEAGILKPERFRTWFQADLAVTCRPHTDMADPDRQHAVPDPLVIVEILSPSTEDHDRKVKLPLYRTLSSVQEIVLVDSGRMFTEVHRRLDSSRWEVDLLTEGDAVLRLDSIGLEQPLSVVYDGVAIPAP